jgi:hypothetical protein
MIAKAPLIILTGPLLGSPTGHEAEEFGLDLIMSNSPVTVIVIGRLPEIVSFFAKYRYLRWSYTYSVLI